MNDRISRIIRDIENRYLNEREERAILDYLESVPGRLETVREMEKHEDAAAANVVKVLRKKYPKFDRFHDFAWDKSLRDARLVARTVAQAVLLDDTRYLDEKLLFWFRTICKSFGLTPQFVRDAYTALRDGYAETMSERAFAEVEPFFDRTVQVLSDFPEPEVARV